MPESASDSATERPTWVRWQIVVLLITFSFMTWFNRISIEVAGRRIIHAKILTEVEIGSVYSAFFLAYTLCMTPGGWLSDRFGPRFGLVVMGLGSAVFVAMTGLVGFAGLSAGMLLIALIAVRSAMGVFTAPIYPGSGRMISHWIPPQQRAWANGVVQGFAAVGIASSYRLFGALIDHFGWPTAFLITGAVTGLLAVAFAVYATDSPEQHRLVNRAELEWIRPGGATTAPAGSGPTERATQPDEPDQTKKTARVRAAEPMGWASLLSDRGLILLTLSYAAVGYFEYLFFHWVPYYFETVLEFEKARSEFYASIPPLAMGLGMPLGGWLSDRLVWRYGYRFGRAIVPAGGMVAGAVLLALGLVVAARTKEPLWIVTCFSLALAAVGMCEGPIWATAIDLGRRRGATVAGIVNTGGNAGGTLAPYVTPWVGTTLGWGYALTLSSIICLAGAFLWCWINPGQRDSDAE